MAGIYLGRNQYFYRQVRGRFFAFGHPSAANTNCSHVILLQHCSYRSPYQRMSVCKFNFLLLGTTFAYIAYIGGNLCPTLPSPKHIKTQFLSQADILRIKFG